MLGTDIALKHQMAVSRHNEFLAEARKQRTLDEASGHGRRPRRELVHDARSTIANLLIRAGSWLMPEEPCAAASSGLELRPGR